MKKLNRQLRASLLGMAVLTAFAAIPSQAATITVNTTTDKVSGTGCSLREAIMSVNAGSNQGGCTVNPNAGFGPGLLGLLGAAMAGLFLRRRRQVAARR